MKLIAGKLNNCNTIYFWNVKEKVKIGDYAIVENINDYDLVKIVGIIDTDEKYQKHFCKQKINKDVIMIVPRKDIRND